MMGWSICQHLVCRHGRAAHASETGQCLVLVADGQLCACPGWRLARVNKYGARQAPCPLGDTPHVHDSLAERRRHFVLVQREAAGEITELRVHAPRLTLTVDGYEIGHYTPDHSYYEDDLLVIEDTKSPATRRRADYQLRKKLVRALYGLVIRETE